MKRSSKAGGRAGKAWRRTAATQARPNPPKAASGRRPATTTQETEIARLTREHDEALEREKASAEVLRVIGSSPGDPRPVFEAVLENAARICEAKFGNLLLYDGASFRVAAIRGAVPAFEDLRRRNPTFQIDSTSPLGRLVTTKQAQHIIDLKLDPAYAARATTMVTLVDVAGARTFLAVPMLKESQLLGVFAIYRQEVRAFTDRQIELVQNFAAQTVIAIENARLLNELRQRTTDLTESLEQQTATAEVLEVISGSPGELEPTFNAVLESAARICEARNALIFLRDGDVAVTRAQFGPMEGTPIGYRTPPLNRDLVVGRAILDARIINVTDLANSDDFPLGRELARRYGHRATLAVPLIREGIAIGAIVVRRPESEPRPFTNKQIELVANFARQAVIAIENARLLAELRESLQQQIATADVLKVISSSPGDLEPVFNAMLQNAVRICDATFGNLLLFDGNFFRHVALHNAPPAWAEETELDPVPPRDRARVLYSVAETKQVAHVVDMAVENPDEPISEIAGARTVLIVPMLKERELVGAIAIYRQEVRPFVEKQIDLLKNFAAQAVIAIENTRLLNELRARTDELARSVGELRALGEVGQAVNSTLDVETVLRTIVAKAVELSATDAGAIYVFDAERQEFRLRATYGMSEAMIAAITDRHIGMGHPNVGEAARRREPIQIADLREAPASALNDILLGAGYRALLLVPLLGPNRIVGALVVRRREPGAFPQAAVGLLQTFAHQSVLAIQNARLFREIEEKGRQLEVASKHKSQFLANMSHELRTPLNAILGYTELILDSIYGEPTEKMRAVLERLQANGKHLLGLINDVLDLSKIEAGQLTLSLEDYSLSDLVHGIVSAVEPLAVEKRLAFKAEVAPDLPTGRGDARRLSQVLLNLVGNAIKFTDKGEVAIRASATNGAFTVSVCDTGPGIAAADQAKIFEEFQQADSSISRKKGGTGLGLSIVKRIIDMHGGRIWVDSVVDQGSTFSFMVPIRVLRQVNAT